MSDLDGYAGRERHARALEVRYGLAPHGVDVRAAYPPGSAAGRSVTVAWIETPARLVRAGLVDDEQVAALRDFATGADAGRAALQWSDEAGTRWVLSTNGTMQGEAYALWLTASYLPDAEALNPAAEEPEFVRDVEALVQAATGRRIRFGTHGRVGSR